MNQPIHILQFGEGNFLRAFVDWMFTKSNQLQVTNASIVIVKPRSGGQSLLDTFRKQNCRFHVCIEGFEHNILSRELLQVNCVDDIVSPYFDEVAYRNYILDPKLQILISNTSEAGIVYRPENIFQNAIPIEFPAKLVRLLYERYRFFKGDLSKGLHIICCELIDNNADILRSIILRHIADNGLETPFSCWIDRACYFHNSLVDRIVSGYPREEAPDIEAQIGHPDPLLTKAELYHSWLIEDDGVLQKLMPLDKAGLNVRFSTSISRYRQWKVRILNGQHTAMAIVGLLAGVKTVNDTFNHPLVFQFIRLLLENEIIPSLDGDRHEIESYALAIEERLRNPCIKHTLNDIFLNCTSKWVARLCPTMSYNYRSLGKHSPFCAFTLAALLYIYTRQPDGVNRICINDDAHIVEKIRFYFASQDPIDWIMSKLLSDISIWNQNLLAYPGLYNEIICYFLLLQKMGFEATLKYLLDLER